MARADAGTIVAVEVLVKEDVIPPVRVRLELFCTTVDWPASLVVAFKGADQALCQFPGDVEQIHEISGTCWALYLERVPVVGSHPQQRGIQHHVDGHPNRPAPIGVATEHTAVG